MGTLRRECLNQQVFLSERHLAEVVAEFVEYYNTARPHQGIDSFPATPHERGPPEPPVDGARLEGRPVLGGLAHDYQLAA